MNHSLTINGAPHVLAAVLNFMASLPEGANSHPAAMGAQPLPMPSGDDDTTGDVAAQPGSLDADGLPHDKRIHSEEPTLTTKNQWRKRRGVTADLISQVEAELRARSGQPAPAPQPVAPSPIPAPVATTAPTPQPMPMPTAPVQPQAPVAPQPMPMPTAPVYEGEPVAPQPVQPQPVVTQPVQPQPAPAAAGAPQVGTDFGTFMQYLTGQMTSQVITTDYLAGVIAELSQGFQVQLNAITDVAADPNKINFAIQCFQRDGRW